MDDEKRTRSVLENLDRKSASERFDDVNNWQLNLLGFFAPKHFYKWPLWKKLLLAIPVAILFVAFLALRGMISSGQY